MVVDLFVCAITGALAGLGAVNDAVGCSLGFAFVSGFFFCEVARGAVRRGWL